MDRERFRQVCDDIVKKEAYAAGGIGTLGEKTLHAALKDYLEPDKSRHERPVGRYVADIVTSDGIIEIQTRSFEKLRTKLECFLAQTHVTVVYPVAQVKWLIWIDEATGETTKKRRSPKIGQPFEVFPELYKIKRLLCSENLSIRIVLLHLEEYRNLNGWSKNRKKGSSRYDRIPLDIADDIVIQGPDGYQKLIPDSLAVRFTARDFKAASGLTLKSAQEALNVLHTVGAVVRVGKTGNAYLYERAPDDRHV
jgi:hypothetical protein